MHEMLDPFATWLRATQVSEFIRDVPWLWPACEIAHFVGLSLLVGVVGFFDLRLLGAFRRVPLHAAWSLVPLGQARVRHRRVHRRHFLHRCTRPIRQQRGVLRQAGLSADRRRERCSIRNPLWHHG
jgi:hypothetical protein